MAPAPHQTFHNPSALRQALRAENRIWRERKKKEKKKEKEKEKKKRKKEKKKRGGGGGEWGSLWRG